RRLPPVGHPSALGEGIARGRRRRRKVRQIRDRRQDAQAHAARLRDRPRARRLSALRRALRGDLAAARNRRQASARRSLPQALRGDVADRRMAARRSARRLSMAFTGFPRETLAFLEGINADNSKEWFTGNRPLYDATVAAAKGFVE